MICPGPEHCQHCVRCVEHAVIAEREALHGQVTDARTQAATWERRAKTYRQRLIVAGITDVSEE